MAKHDDVLAQTLRRSGPLIDVRHAIRQLEAGFGTDRPARGQSHVTDDEVGTGFRHVPRLLGVEHVGRCQEVEPIGGLDQVHLEAVAHAGLLKVGAKSSIDQSNRGKILHSRETEIGKLAQKVIGDHERVGSVDAGQNRGASDDRKHLTCHLDDDLVGVAIRHHACERAAAGHPVAAGIVDDDEVDAARFFAFGRESRACAATDDWLLAANHVVKLLEDILAENAWHGLLS